MRRSAQPQFQSRFAIRLATTLPAFNPLKIPVDAKFQVGRLPAQNHTPAHADVFTGAK